MAACLAGLWAGFRISQGPAGTPPAATESQQAAAQAYLAQNLAPMPDGWDRDLFLAAPGVTLEVGTAPAAGPAKGTLVFVPGYTAPLDMYGAEFSRLRAAGWNVAAFSYRGQGRSVRRGPDPQMGWMGDMAHLAADLAAYVRTLDGPVGVMAVSKGGHIALRMAIDAGPDVLGYALVAPMVAIRTEPFSPGLAQGLAMALPVIGLADTYAPAQGPWDGADVFDDPAALAEGGTCARDPARAHLREALFTLEPGLRVGGPSARWIAEVFEAQDVLRDRAGDIATPVWMALASDDGSVVTEASEALCRAMGDCVSVEVPDSLHCMIEDRPEIRDAVFDGALAFFEARLAADRP
ncbi:lysophospholipase L2 [Jannaschia aquimarina]|uniref:Lysophospholipase L2 n=2 Tax=Jannaschia aquimarina TaxID=935700 RepID=A0A0D1EE71_9RHOB|nr:alpha/beta fold hydrolase [Jannaschia aquimarina]KIT15206.1 lysophospholipase L2 [Jannaschia aquimarina]SNT32930.1 Lysophospholipase, alpha-beta hydrolase superfamily [Jannaschia aquimarina]